MQKKIVVDAELTVGFLNFKESYVSIVTAIPFKSVEVRVEEITLIEGILKFSYRPSHLLQLLSSKLCPLPGDFRAIRSPRHQSLKMTQTPLILLVRL